MTGKIADEYLDREAAGADMGVSPYSVGRMQRAVNGLRYVLLGNRAMTTREWIREYLDRRSKIANPLRVPRAPHGRRKRTETERRTT